MELLIAQTKYYVNRKLVKISLDSDEQKRENVEVISDCYCLPSFEGITKKAIVIGRHKVNLFNLNCSCKDFRTNVKLFPKRDVRRICKHLYAKLFSETENKLDELTKILLHNQFWFGQTNVKRIRFYNQDLYVGLHRAGSIISVFKEVDSWQKYLYDFVLDEWLNSSMPFDSPDLNNELTSLIKELNYQIKMD
jgi:hypothetical protein